MCILLGSLSWKIKEQSLFTFPEVSYIFNQVVVLTQTKYHLLDVTEPILWVNDGLHFLLQLMMSLGHFSQIFLFVLKLFLQIFKLTFKLSDFFCIVFFQFGLNLFLLSVVSGQNNLLFFLTIAHHSLLVLLQRGNLISEVLFDSFQTIDLDLEFVDLAWHILDCIVILFFELVPLSVYLFIMKLLLALEGSIFFLHLSIIEAFLFT